MIRLRTRSAGNKSYTGSEEDFGLAVTGINGDGNFIAINHYHGVIVVRKDDILKLEWVDDAEEK